VKATASLLLLAALPAATAQDIAVFRTRADLIYVDVFVTRGGVPVRGLAVEAFDVRDDGRHREVELIALEEVPLEARLLFDVSRSLQGQRLEHLRDAGRSFLPGLGPRDRVGLVTFSAEVRERLPPTGDPAALSRALDRLQAGGMTALYDGLYATLLLDGGPGRRMIVLFSDGADTVSWLGERQVLRVVEESNVLIHAVAVGAGHGTAGDDAAGQSSRFDVLERIAERTGGQLWLASSSVELEAAFGRIIDAMKSRYLLRL